MASRDIGRDGPVATEPIPPGTPRSKVVGGRFAIERLIARGGMGAVYLAHQINLGRSVALKIMSPPPDADEGDSFEDRFRLEAETLAAMHHPNIVTVYDYGPTDDGRFYLAMEYIEGPRFTELVRKGRLAPERCVRLMLQVCNALKYAHKRGVVHRDLKPSNLLIQVEDGVETVKVVDFGLVKVAEADQSLTRAGLVLGSPHCMAPEQVRGEAIDHRADLYAIGILLFRSLTGHWPFHGDTVAGTMIAHVHEERPTFFSVAPDLMVPEGLEAIVQRLLKRDPAERFADASELMAALSACLEIPEDQFLTVSSYHGRVEPQAVGATQAPARRWVIPLLAAAGLLLAVLALGLLRPWDRSAPDPGGPPVAPGPSLFAPATPLPVETPAPAVPEPGLGPPPPDAELAPEAAPAPAAPAAAPAPAAPAAPAPGSTKAPAEKPSAKPATKPAASAPEAAPEADPDPEPEVPAGFLPLPDDF